MSKETRGTGVATGGGNEVDGNAVQAAMAKAVEALHAERLALSRNTKLSEEEKARRDAELLDPTEMRRRMLAARQALKDGSAA